MSSELRVPRINFIALTILLASVGLALLASQAFDDRRVTFGILAVGLILMQAPRVAQQWDAYVCCGWGASSIASPRLVLGSCPFVDPSRLDGPRDYHLIGLEQT